MKETNEMTWGELVVQRDATLNIIDHLKAQGMNPQDFVEMLAETNEQMDCIQDAAADLDHNSYMSNQDISPAQLAGEQFQDRYDMYRREY